MGWQPRPTWQPCRPVRVGNHRANRENQPPAALPAPRNYRIPRIQPPVASPDPVSPPRPIRTSTPAGSPDSDTHVRRVAALQPLQPLRARIGPFSATLPRRFQQMQTDLDAATEPIRQELRQLRRQQLDHHRRTPAYRSYAQDIDLLQTAIDTIRDARRILVAPRPTNGRDSVRN
jgi:hypothetical protein